MRLLILCSLFAASLAAPGGLYGLSGLGGLGGIGLDHGYGLGGISVEAAPVSIAAAPVAVAAPTIVKSIVPQVIAQPAPTIIKTIAAPAATSYATFSQVHINHPAPVIKYAAAPAIAVAQPVVKYAAAPAISVAHPVAVAQPVVKYASAPTIISGFGGHGFGHGISLH